jgi:hypothetical protein
MANTVSKFNIGLSQKPPKLCPETNKEIAFFIIERLEVSKGLDCSNLTLLSPLAFLFKVFTPTQIPNYIGLPQEF